MKYCVVKGTAATIAQGDEEATLVKCGKSTRDNRGNIIEYEILTEEEYLARVELEPEPIAEPTEIEELSNYILDVDFRVMMIEMGL